MWQTLVLLRIHVLGRDGEQLEARAGGTCRPGAERVAARGSRTGAPKTLRVVVIEACPQISWDLLQVGAGLRP